MPRNGSGVFNRLYSWTADAANNVRIRSDRMDAEDNGFAVALTDSLPRDGQAGPTADLPMGGFRHTGVGAATARGDYAQTGQVLDGALAWFGIATGAVNTLTLAAPIPMSAFATGQRIRFIANNTNNNNTVTVTVPGAGTVNVSIGPSGRVPPGEIVAGRVTELVYDGTYMQVTNSTGILSVRDFGARGDGIAVDTAAIERALSAAFSRGGGVVYIPWGTYKCNGKIGIPGNVSLVGDGTAATTLDFVSSGAAVDSLWVRNSAHNVALQDFTVENSKRHGIYFETIGSGNNEAASLKRVNVLSSTGDGIRSDGINSLVMSEVSAKSSGVRGVNLAGHHPNFYAEKIGTDNNASEGFRAFDSRGYIVSCTSSANSGSAYIGVASLLNYTNCYGTANGGPLFRVEDRDSDRAASNTKVSATIIDNSVSINNCTTSPSRGSFVSLLCTNTDAAKPTIIRIRAGEDRTSASGISVETPVLGPAARHETVLDGTAYSGTVTGTVYKPQLTLI